MIKTIQDLQPYFSMIRFARKGSHKGQNGKLLLIGGSALFHAASAWSLDVASRIVDMVFYSSVLENNQHITAAKEQFWDGVVVPRGELENYIDEADCILVGPGMTRSETITRKPAEFFVQCSKDSIDWESDTYAITNYLLAHYPQKLWVIDAGALQMAEPALFSKSMIVTPHRQEFTRVFGRPADQKNVWKMSKRWNNVLILLKGEIDTIADGEKLEEVYGGNEGMIKGGTGDVLAGIIASLYCTSPAFESAVVGSFINKRAGDTLYASVGAFYNTSDLVAQIPKTMKDIVIAVS